MEKIYAIKGYYIWQSPPDYYISFFRNKEDAEYNKELLDKRENEKFNRYLSKNIFCPREDFSILTHDICGSVDNCNKIYIIATGFMLDSDIYRFFFNNKKDAYAKWDEIKQKYYWDEEKDGEWKVYEGTRYSFLEANIACSKKDVPYYSKTKELEPMMYGKRFDY